MFPPTAETCAGAVRAAAARAAAGAARAAADAAGKAGGREAAVAAEAAAMAAERAAESASECAAHVARWGVDVRDAVAGWSTMRGAGGALLGTGDAGPVVPFWCGAAGGAGHVEIGVRLGMELDGDAGAGLAVGLPTQPLHPSGGEDEDDDEDRIVLGSGAWPARIEVLGGKGGRVVAAAAVGTSPAVVT